MYVSYTAANALEQGASKLASNGPTLRCDRYLPLVCGKIGHQVAIDTELYHHPSPTSRIKDTEGG